LYTWNVTFPSATFFESAPELFQDLMKYGAEYGKAEEVVLRIHFTPRFPTTPPFVRVIRPKFMFHTGHVTIGGSICTEVLTASNTPGSWQSTITMENLILLLHNLIGVDGKGQWRCFPQSHFNQCLPRL
jgi:ubiquitin-conjugating enzyme E2 Q